MPIIRKIGYNAHMTHAIKTLLIGFAAVLVGIGPAFAANIASVTLIPQYESVQANTTFRIAFKIDMPSGWHTYWKYPGPVGKAPEIRWDSPLGGTPTEFSFPVPERIPYEGGISYGYSDSVTLTTEISVPPISAGNFIFGGKLIYLVCETDCHLETYPFQLTLPITKDMPAENPHFSQAIGQTEAFLFAVISRLLFGRIAIECNAVRATGIISQGLALGAFRGGKALDSRVEIYMGHC
jgi:DsbC/DsbD-like thiol-disulfide interchange protein